FDWLLKERDGEAHALLRRLGIMYIIFDKHILGAYNVEEGWRDYKGSNPHTDHVHFSFGWDGARQDTTWWTARGEPSFCEQANLDFESYPALTKGDTGDEVTAAQCLLDKAGRPAGEGDPDGEYDGTTGKAVKKFQSDIGLKSTGEIDSHTWTALLGRGSNVELQEGEEGRNVSRLQRALTAALDTTVSIDGKFTADTTKAVKKYQERAGLDADGIVGPKTWAAMRSGV
ncbi:MAG: peptidoglycan-binding domain-containing protein, partial [Stackebrandtia sp.]